MDSPGDGKTPPIEPQDFIGGVTVVDFGDLRVARGLSRRPARLCRHHGLRYDPRERRIWCADCENDVEPYDAFELLVEHFDRAQKKTRRMLEEAQAAQDHALISIAAKEMDRHFRRKKMVPTCPHCKQGIWPEDVKGMGAINKEWDAAVRNRRLSPPSTKE